MAKEKKSAGARIKAQGRSLVWVTLSEAEKRRVRAAAGYADQPMSQFIVAAALAAAEKVLAKNRDGAGGS
jgi:uncharacterized protein (DUF1778 family)